MSDDVGQIKSLVWQMFIAGKRPKQTQQSGADISIRMSKEVLIVGGSASPQWKVVACMCACLSVGIGRGVGGVLSFPVRVPSLCLRSGLNARQILSYDLIHCKANKERNVRQDARKRFYNEIPKGC